MLRKASTCGTSFTAQPASLVETDVQAISAPPTPGPGVISQYTRRALGAHDKSAELVRLFPADDFWFPWIDDCTAGFAEQLLDTIVVSEAGYLWTSLRVGNGGAGYVPIFSTVYSLAQRSAGASDGATLLLTGLTACFK